MTNIYTTMVYCVKVESVGLPGHNNVYLSIDPFKSNAEIVLKGTLSRFVQGKQYLLNLSEL